MFCTACCEIDNSEIVVTAMNFWHTSFLFLANACCGDGKQQELPRQSAATKRIWHWILQPMPQMRLQARHLRQEALMVKSFQQLIRLSIPLRMEAKKAMTKRRKFQKYSTLNYPSGTRVPFGLGMWCTILVLFVEMEWWVYVSLKLLKKVVLSEYYFISQNRIGNYFNLYNAIP